MNQIRFIANLSQSTRIYYYHLVRNPWFKLVVGLTLITTVLSRPFLSPVQASEDSRTIKTTTTMLAHHWGLLRWSTGVNECNIYIKGDGFPTVDDVKINCSDEIYQSWLNTPACASAASVNVSDCTGLYLRDYGEAAGPVTEIVEVPPPSIKVVQTNCPPWDWCDEIPNLAFVGSEPMQGQTIKTIHVRLNNEERMCAAIFCELRMPFTGDHYVQVEYWAVSSSGDESPHQILQLRNIPPKTPADKYRLEVLSVDWANHAPPGAVRWGLFPATDNPIAQLINQPAATADLATQHSYFLLAGKLIQNKIVDAKSCPGGGLMVNGMANTCGEQRARDLVYTWQNRYDTQIISAALLYDVPARLLKALIARETQFWPDSGSPYELGLGRVTENGADLLLNWNLSYYLNLCTKIYGSSECAFGFSHLSAEQKTMLRAKALSAIGTTEEINLIAAIMRASSEQVTQMLYNETKKDVAKVTTLEDMWALSIANYHTGSGCIGMAMDAQPTYQYGITWDDIANDLPTGCDEGKPYVDEVLGLAQ